MVAKGQQVFQTIRATNYKWQFPDGGALELVGICQVESSGIACWRPDGVVDEAITKACVTKFENSDSRAVLRYGSKNRYLAVKARRTASQSSYQGANWVLNGGSSTAANGQTNLPSDGGYEWLHFAVDPDAKSASLYTELFHSKPGVPEMRLRAGETTTIDGSQLKIVKVGEIKREALPQKLGMMRESKFPPVVSEVQVQIPVDSLNAGYGISLLNEKKQMIVYVNSSGKPVAPFGRQETYHYVAPNDPNRKYYVSSGSDVQNGVVRFLIQVKPNDVAYCIINRTDPIKIDFGSIPLDPKS